MKQFALIAAAALLVAAPALAEDAAPLDLPMDEHDGLGTAIDADLSAAVGDVAHVSTTVETTVKTTSGGTVDALTGATLTTTPSDTQVTTSVTTEVTPAGE